MNIPGILPIFHNRTHSLPFPEFSTWRKDGTGKDLIDVTWKSVCVKEECFKKAKDICSSNLSSTQTLALDIDALIHWQEVLSEKPACDYIQQVSAAVSSAIRSKFPDAIKNITLTSNQPQQISP